MNFQAYQYVLKLNWIISSNVKTPQNMLEEKNARDEWFYSWAAWKIKNVFKWLRI